MSGQARGSRRLCTAIVTSPTSASNRIAIRLPAEPPTNDDS
jgi:hypothetical protein